MENINNYIYDVPTEIEAIQSKEDNEIEFLGFSNYKVYENKYGYHILESTGQKINVSDWLCKIKEGEYAVIPDATFNILFNKKK